MKALFADTFYWSALLNLRDDWHPQVRQFSQSLTGVPLITTEEVLTELLNFFSSFRYVTRQGAVKLVDDILANPNIQVILQTHETFLAGFSLYRQRLNQEYSLTDCISTETMRRLGLTEVLTHDRHFTQEGFTILFP